MMLFSILVLPSGSAVADDDSQRWHQLSVKAYDGERFGLTVFSDARFTNESEKLGLYFISPRLTYHLSELIDLGLNYTYLQSRNTSPSAPDDSFNRQHRLEPEINPKWIPADWLTVKWRHRFEIRWIEGRKDNNNRFRQLWHFELPLKSNKVLKSLYISSEYFFDLNGSGVNENRTVPLGMNFKVNDHVGLKLYYMLQSQKGSADWSTNQAVGTLMSVKF